MFNPTSQLILGTLLGNSKLVSCDDGVFLFMRSKDEMWLKSKVHELEKFHGEFRQGKTMYYWKSISHPIFTEFDEKIYKGESKIVSMELLDYLMDYGIGIWYGDIGCLVGRARQNACLRTQVFGKKGNEIIAEWFNSVGIPCGLNKHRHSYVTVFTLEGSRILFDMVSPILPINRRHLIT